jgi:hypothetical protein
VTRTFLKQNFNYLEPGSMNALIYTAVAISLPAAVCINKIFNALFRTRTGTRKATC